MRTKLNLNTRVKIVNIPSSELLNKTASQALPESGIKIVQLEHF